MPGVVAVVRDGSFLGVAAEREEQAIKAREALRKSAKWTLGPELPDPARIFEVIKSLPSKDATIGVKQGAAPTDARMFEAVYTKPPVTFAGMSKRGMDFPTILWFAGDFGAAFAVASRLRSGLSSA